MSDLREGSLAPITVPATLGSEVHPVDPMLKQPDLIDWLTAKQQALGLNDSQYQTFLGVADLSMWIRLKHRDRQANLKLMQLACRAFPKEQGAIFEAAKRSSIRRSKRHQHPEAATA